MIIFILLLSVTLSAIAPFAVRSVPRVLIGALVFNTVSMGIGVWVGASAMLGSAPLSGGNLWYVDAFSGLLVALISLVQWTATMASIPYLRAEEHEGVIGLPHVRRYFSLFSLFVLSMLVTVMANSLGLMWVALEATTLATTMLVAFYSRKDSIEAAWKYLILCSTGIALGLIGVLLAYFAATSGGAVSGENALLWSVLRQNASLLPPELLRVAFVFVLIGYGAKAGLVPMHAWLPDAHSSAPAPISGMLSGVLLNAALFAVIKFKLLTDAALGSHDWTNSLLIAFGAISVIVPAAFIILQADYKRLLAYSSIEHIGFIVFSIGLGGVGIVAGLIHMVGHALSKSALFFGAGNILERFKSTKFVRVGAVLRTLPITGSLFAVLLLMLLAVPPSPLFMSELQTGSVGFVSHGVITLAVFGALALIFAGFIHTLMPFLFSRTSKPVAAHAEKTEMHAGERFNLSHAAMLIHIVLLCVMGALLMEGDALLFFGNIAALIS